MKRDMNLIRAILSEIETNLKPCECYKIDHTRYPKHSEEEVDEHCRLIAERGLAEVSNTFDGILFTGLTWDGHDFLDNARNNRVWQATRKAAGDLSFGVFVEVLKSVAVEYAKSLISLK